MRLIVDSGSTWFWVQTVDCENCGGHEKFDPSESSSIQYTRMHKTLYYGSGNVSGSFAREDVCLTEPFDCFWNEDGYECVDVCIQQISTILVDHNVGLQALEADGIIGLAPTARERFADLFIEKAHE